MRMIMDLPAGAKNMKKLVLALASALTIGANATDFADLGVDEDWFSGGADGEITLVAPAKAGGAFFKVDRK